MKCQDIFHFNLIRVERRPKVRNHEPLVLGLVEKEPILGFVEHLREPRPHSQITVTKEFNRLLERSNMRTSWPPMCFKLKSERTPSRG